MLEKEGAGLAKRNATLPPLLAAILPTRFEKPDAARERMVNLLLDAGADPNAASMGVTPLLLAARHGNAAIIKRLLAAGARVSAKDHKQRNALHRAAETNQPAELVKLLLNAGIDPNEVDAGAEFTPLSWYVMHGNVEACRVMLQAGADPNGDPLFPMTKPLMSALGFQFSGDAGSCGEIVTLLLKHGARVMGLKGDPEQSVSVLSIIPGCKAKLIPVMTAAQHPPFQPGSPDAAKYLMVACLAADAPTLRALLDLGIDPSMPDEEGYSPLANAAVAGQIANMVLLLESGVSPDDAGKNGVPPIWRAAAYGQTRALRLLLAAGATPDAVHPARKTTPLDVARKRGDRAIIACLEGVGVR